MLTNFTLTNGDIKLNILTKMIDSPKAVLIHVHGIGSHFQPIFNSVDCLENRIILLDQQFISYGIELRGHGLSDGIRFSINSFDDYLADLHILVEYIKIHHPTLPIFILGHSMGGTITIMYSIKYSGIINGVILLAPMCGIDEVIKLSWLTRKVMTIASYIIPSYKLTSINSDKHLKNYQKEFIDAKRNCPLQNNNGIRLDLSRECYYAMTWTSENNYLFTIPVLAIHSMSDCVTHCNETEKFITNCSSTDKTLIVPLIGQHNLLAPMFEDDEKPREILDTINKWLLDRI